LLTEIDLDVAGDTHFPSWDRAGFHEESREERVSETGVPFAFVRYVRRT
jgi:dihydrofolate reductase